MDGHKERVKRGLENLQALLLGVVYLSREEMDKVCDMAYALGAAEQALGVDEE